MVEHIPEKWSSVQSIIRIETERRVAGKTSFAARYSVCSHEIGTKEAQEAARCHWALKPIFIGCSMSLFEKTTRAFVLKTLPNALP
jgi:hypothetical protein